MDVIRPDALRGRGARPVLRAAVAALLLGTLPLLPAAAEEAAQIESFSLDMLTKLACRAGLKVEMKLRKAA